jgi:ATP-dependent exoDNAse (exonuclease V) alpha subunit
LNPADEHKVERFGWTLAPGDKVMQIENDYDKKVYNGDVGYVMGVEAGGGELTGIVDGRSVTYGFGELASHLCLRRFSAGAVSAHDVGPRDLPDLIYSFSSI